MEFRWGVSKGLP